MRVRFSKCWSLGLALVLASGCLSPVREQVDTAICDLAAQPLDAHTPVVSPPAPAAPAKPPTKLEERLELHPDLPGSHVQIEQLPEKATEAQKKAYAAKYFPPLSSMPPKPKPQPGLFGHPLTLLELQQLAMSNSPTLRQAAADVEAARGAAKQAGAYPNPTFGYDSSNVNTGGTAGFQGVFFDQVIKTAGKLKTAQASALISLMNAELALRKAQTDLMAQVRGNYFAFLVAEKNLRLNEALAVFNERVYLLSVDQGLGGIIARYEPMQLRAFTNQARALLVSARNRYISAWNQLAASLGLHDLPLTEVAGSAEMTVPAFNQEEVLARVLKSHTDVFTARNTLQKARYDLHTAEIAPYPDLDLRVAVHKDFTTPPFGVEQDITAGFAIPIWDQNRGAIRQAQGALVRATEEEHRVQNALATSVADAYERYATNQATVKYYRDKVFPDLGLVYSRAVLRYGDLKPGDIGSVASLDYITHQQIYSSAIATYSTALAAQWQAVADLSGLLQIDDLYLGVAAPPHHDPDCNTLPGLPCSHPCSPLPASAPAGDEGK